MWIAVNWRNRSWVRVYGVDSRNGVQDVCTDVRGTLINFVIPVSYSGTFYFYDFSWNTKKAVTPKVVLHYGSPLCSVSQF